MTASWNDIAQHPLRIAFLILLPLAGACQMSEMVPAEMVSTTESQPRGNETSLATEVSFDIGALEISAGEPDSIYSVDLEYDKAGYQPEVQYEAAAGDGRLRIKLEGKGKSGVRHRQHSNRMRLNLTDSLPLRLDVRTGVGEARLSLSNLRVQQLEFAAGVGDARVSAYEPNPEVCERIRLRSGVGGMEAVGLGNLNFRELDFEGGVGGANLDLSGEWKQDATIRVEVGVGGVNLRVPRDIGVRVDAEKHFLSGFSLEGMVQRESGYYSENYDDAKIRISIRVQTGIGGFKLTWI